ncbi:MAG: hypothetical protein A2017_10405 [Lentisphaerae bacterium GWF2_44_16]|nr:MAG: hypothetical protein A2017_10405 [Lentisphaerae bacterium GWF2_44_16]
MCGRFTLSLSAEELKAALDIEVWDDEDAYVPSWNTAPSMETPVFYDGVLSMMNWGIASSKLFSSIQEKLIINIRRETFLSSLASAKRCVIPAGGYYEWMKKEKASIPYYFSPSALPLIFFAGLWYEERGKSFFAVLTTEAKGEAAKIHRRSPVILVRDLLGDWLGSETSSAPGKIFDEASARSPEMKFYTVSGNVNCVSNNSPECIREFDYNEQPDLF